jgi:hypothetical protein
MNLFILELGYVPQSVCLITEWTTVVRHYTDWATPATFAKMYGTYNSHYALKG